MSLGRLKSSTMQGFRPRALGATAVLLTLLAPQGSSQSTQSPGAMFKFQSNFWVNLHHFVRAESRRQSVGSPPLIAVSGLGEAERERWRKALDSYTELTKVSLIFSERLVSINNALGTIPDAETLPADAAEPPIVEALNAAAPIYRAHLWGKHRRENEEWIARFTPTIEEHAAAVTKALAAVYQVDWPTEPLLVDLAAETGPTNAYTTAGPPGTAGHTVIAPLKTADLDAAFEIAFHEASHTVDSHLIKMVAEESERQKVKPPPDLWHVLLFYTTGEVAKRELGKQNDSGYQPYAYRHGLYETGEWARMSAALEEHWQPYLDGKVDLSTALRNLVRAASA